VILYMFFRFARCLATSLPLKVGYKGAEALADVYYFFARSDKINLEENLKHVLKINDKKIICKHIRSVFRNFAKYLVDFFRFSEEDIKSMLKVTTINGKENLDKTLAEGKGALLVSAHLGNWELGAAVVGCLGYDLHAITLDHKDKRVNDLFLSQRLSCNVTSIPIGAQLRNCFKVLKNNRPLAIAGDRDFTENGTEIEFFGEKTLMPKGPAFFGLKTGAPIIPTFLIRNEDDSFKMVFATPIKANPTGDREKDMEALMKKYISVLERYIKANPDQWYAFKKMWPE